MNTPLRPNPLSTPSALPRFDEIQAADIAPGIDALLADAETALATVTAEDFPAEWRLMAKTLDVATERLGMAWGAVSHLNSVADTPEWRAAYNAVLPMVTEFWTRLGADERLYAKYKAMDPSSLNAEQARAHFNSMRGFVLGGAELQGAAKERFAAIQERQAELSQKFSENALDATDRFALYVERDQLDGVPEDVLAATAAAAQAEGKTGHKLNLKMPCYLPVMQFAKNSAVREQLYRA
jgi:oligopeptidase A